MLETIESGAMIIVNRSHRIPWALVPHVDPAPNQRRRVFYREVRRVLRLATQQSISADRLAAALRNSDERKRLRACYEHIVSGGSGPRHNRVSMSLYSGPAEPGNETSWWGYAMTAYSEHWPAWWIGTIPLTFLGSERTAVGWLGTGDAPLNINSVRTAWQRSFLPFRDQIATLLLPHHGSRHSFHPSLLDLPQLEVCIASAGDQSSYGHPHPQVVRQVEDRRKVMHHVSQRPQTELCEVICSL